MIKSRYLSLDKKQRTTRMRLAELLGLLSYALDMTEGQPRGHCIRCCWIGSQIGAVLDLSDESMADLYFTLLLKDLGCSSNAARICDLFLVDDIEFKRDFKTIDDSMSAALRFVFKKTGLESGLSERIRALINALQNSETIGRELIETRCHRGADIAKKMRFSDTVQDGIRYLDEHWNGAGKPDNLKADAIPLNSNIALLAQVVDVFHNTQNKDAAIAEAKSRSGGWFGPELVEAFLVAQAKPGFWESLESDQLEDIVLDMQPARQSAFVDEDFLDEIATAFSDVVDAKSPYTADHSNRVTLYTDMIAEELGLLGDHRRWLRRAALLHDIGKLAVSNQILDKPGKLSEEEWVTIKSHPLHSEKILEHVAAFRDIAPIAGAHHERLDGTGYPYGLKGDEICLEARILTVADVFDALTAERPYRAAMPIAKALSILDDDTDTAFDADCVIALKRGLERLNAAQEEAA